MTAEGTDLTLITKVCAACGKQFYTRAAMCQEICKSCEDEQITRKRQEKEEQQGEMEV